MPVARSLSPLLRAPPEPHTRDEQGRDGEHQDARFCDTAYQAIGLGGVPELRSSALRTGELRQNGDEQRREEDASSKHGYIPAASKAIR